MKKHILAAAVFAAALAADIISKGLIVSKFTFFDRMDFLGGFLRFTLVYNEGGVFGIFQGYKHIFLIISVIVLAVMVMYYIWEKKKSYLFCTAMGLIASGAVGNIIDRLVADRPGVVDFISIGVDGVYRWPTFNIADMCIIVGAAMLIIIFYSQEKKRRLSSEK